MTQDKVTILKVLVGSQAHGLADENSDYDYRSVYVLPTSKILSIGYNYKGTNWTEGDIDNTAYEIGHFLQLAVKCNPSILEVFKAPVIEATTDGLKLQNLFPYVWNPTDCHNAFIGYGLNQRKKFLERKDARPNKYAIAYIRVLEQLIELLATDDFSVEVKNQAIKEKLLKYKMGIYTFGEIIDEAEKSTHLADLLFSTCKHEPNIEKVNQFLMEIRRRYW